MSSSALSFLLLMTFPLLGGNDLLDMVDTATYWKALHVERTVDAMAAQLDRKPPGDISALIKDLGADEFRKRDAAMKAIRAAGPGVIDQLRKAAEGTNAEVAERAAALIKQLGSSEIATAERRLMAIRALGELKDRAGLPHLQKLLDSKEPFVAEYASAAIASIEGKKFERSRPSAKDRDEDLYLLPKECMFVMQAGAEQRIAVTWEQILKQLAALPDRAAGDEARKNFDAAFRTLVQRAGNVRIDLVTVGVAGKAFIDDGFVVIVFRGKYHTEGFKREAVKLGLATVQVQGYDVVEDPTDRSAAVILASDDRLVLVGSQNGKLKLAEVAAAIKRGRGTFEDNVQFVKLMKTVDRNKALWAASIPDDESHGVTGLDGLESMTLEVSQEKDGLAALCKVNASDAAKMKENLDEAMKIREQVTPFLETYLIAEPSIKPAVDFIKSIKLSNDGKVFTITGHVNDAAGLLILPVIAGRSEVKGQ